MENMMVTGSTVTGLKVPQFNCDVTSLVLKVMKL